LHRMERDLPRPLALTRLGLRSPGWTLLALVFLPHLLGSAVNITYNALCIVGDLSAAQKQAFNYLVWGYNAVVYPVCLWVFLRVVLPVLRVWGRLEGPERVEAAEVARLRRRAVRVPLLMVGLSCLGWLPGGVLFPLGIHLLAGPLPAEAFGHFLVSFAIAGLI